MPTVLGNVTQPSAPRDRNPFSHTCLNILQEFLHTLLSLAGLSPSQALQLRIKLAAALGRCRQALGCTMWGGETSFSEDLTEAQRSLGWGLPFLYNQGVLTVWLPCRGCWWALWERWAVGRVLCWLPSLGSSTGNERSVCPSLWFHPLVAIYWVPAVSENVLGVGRGRGRGGQLMYPKG